MSSLLTDLYQLTMLDACQQAGMDAPAVFELFVRRLPPQRNFLVAAGLEQALQFLETLSFSPQDVDWLGREAGLPPRLLQALERFREGKATWPGVKQVWRRFDANGVMGRDTVQLESEAGAGQALLQPCMIAGRRTGPAPSLEAVRRHHAAAMAALPEALRTLAPAAAPYPVRISAGLHTLAAELDAEPC